MKSDELIQRYWEAKKQHQHLTETATYYNRLSYGAAGKTQVHIPAALIKAEQDEYAEYWKTRSDEFKRVLPPTITKERARERVQEFINQHFNHVKTVSEYSEYRNSITFEVKRFRHYGR
jgi:hypothetical protein